jgi:inosose dehydratase
MPALTRRAWLRQSALFLTAAATPWPAWSAGPAHCTLSIGTYSTRGVPLEKAIALVAETGYDGIEIAVQPGYDGEPAKMPPARRREVRKRLADTRLRLTGLMEQLYPTADAAQHKAGLDRLRRVTELAHDLAPDEPPLVQTVLGGGTWNEKKDLFRNRLGDWLPIFKEAKIVLAIKPHRAGAMSRPDEAIALIRQLGDSPHLRLVYDYSHYAFRDLPLDATVRTALPYTADVALKDAVRQGDKVVFAMPGVSGTFDYAQLLRLFFEGGYRGAFCCEVSAQVFNQPGYDPVAAVKTCYQTMARAFEQARVPRR